ncbi:hypothetical protein ACFLXO_05880 [Chloroflexota bacterium]
MGFSTSPTVSPSPSTVVHERYKQHRRHAQYNHGFYNPLQAGRPIKDYKAPDIVPWAMGDQMKVAETILLGKVKLFLSSEEL